MWVVHKHVVSHQAIVFTPKIDPESVGRVVPAAWCPYGYELLVTMSGLPPGFCHSGGVGQWNFWLAAITQQESITSQGAATAYLGRGKAVFIGWSGHDIS